MSTEAGDPNPSRNPPVVKADDSGDAESPPSSPEPRSNWEVVEDEYRSLVETLNEERVSFTGRSAEGIALYGGLKSHTANGNMSDLAEQGHFEMLKLAEGEFESKQQEANEQKAKRERAEAIQPSSLHARTEQPS
jgi:hypothetical protein